MCSKICHFLARKRNVPLRRNNIRSCLRKSVKLIQASFLIKDCDEMKTDKNTDFFHDWFIQTYLSAISLTILLKTGFFSFLSTASPSISSSLSRSSAGCCPGFRSVLASIWLGFFSSNAAEKITKYEKHTIWVRYFHEKSNSKILWTSCKSYLLKFIYSEKATKFCKIFTLPLTGTT